MTGEVPRSHAPPPTGSWAGRPAGVPSGVPPPSVPLAFLAGASLGLVVTGVAFIWARRAGIPDPTTDPIVAATHFGVLATLSMGVLGAMHQFTPVITGRPLRSIRLARATFLTWLAASWMLPFGIATEQVTVTAISGMFAALAIGLLVVNFTGPLSVRGKGAPVTGLRFALAGSVVTACLGAAFVGDRQGNWFEPRGTRRSHDGSGRPVRLARGYIRRGRREAVADVLPRPRPRTSPARSGCGVGGTDRGGPAVPGLLFNVPGLAWEGPSSSPSAWGRTSSRLWHTSATADARSTCTSSSS